MKTYCKKLKHTQNLQKQANDKVMKPKCYTPSNKVWLNSKFIKTKWNQKLEAKFFGLFQVLQLMSKET